MNKVQTPPDQQISLEQDLTQAKASKQPDQIRKALDALILHHQSQGAIEKCAFYCKDVLHLLQDAGQENELASKTVFIGTCYLRLVDYKLAEEYYNLALEIYRRIDNDFGCAEVLINIGRIYREMGQFEKSLSFLNEALDIYENHKDELKLEENLRPRHSYCCALEVTGIIYSQLKQFERAQEYLLSNITNRRNLGDPEGIMQGLINLGASYSESDPEKALAYFLEARECNDPKISIIPKIALVNNIGGCYENKGDYTQALKFYHEALQMAEDNNMMKYRPQILKHIGYVYQIQGLYDSALEKFQLSLKLSTEEDSRMDMLHCYGSLSDIYYAKEDYKSAFEYQRKVLEIKEVLFNEDLTQKLSVLQKKYDETSIRLLETQKHNSLVTESLKKAISMSFVGVSQSIRQVHELAMTAALHSTTSVLITGESGVGKEIIARIIHHAGSRNNGAFIDVNCSSIPESLAESEFFGYEKGAFTGANTRKSGFLEDANDGTLFLDEVGDTPLLIQAKFLRVLETRQVKPIGANKAIDIDFRLISATNKDISEMIHFNTFRADLLYRINTLEIHIPPLRERKDDIEPLLKHYVTEFCRIMNKPVPSYNPSLIDFLCDYDFPGNVRELKNMIEKAMILTRGNELTRDSFEQCFSRKLEQTEITGHNPISTIDDMETQLLLDALKEAKGNKTKAAQMLGISYSTFKRKYKLLDSTE